MSTRDPLHSREIGPRLETQCDQLRRSSSSIPAAGTTTHAPVGPDVARRGIPPPLARATRRPAWSTRPASPPSSGSASLSVKDESQPARPAVVQDPRRVVGGLPAARRRGSGTSPNGATSTSCAPRSRRSGRSRSSPRPTATTAAPSRTWRGCSATRRASSCPRAPRRRASTGIESEGAPVTVVDGTYDDAVRARRPRSRPTTCSSCRTRRGRATPTCPRTVIEGYATIFAEVDEQLAGARPTSSSYRWASARSPAAVVQHYAARATIVVVEPLSAACGLHSARGRSPGRGARTARLDHGRAQLRHGVDRSRGRRCRRGVDVFVAVDDAAAEHAMRDLAAIGVVAGETGRGRRSPGCAPRSTRGACPTLAGKRVLVLCTEGATDPAAYRRIVGREP